MTERAEHPRVRLDGPRGSAEDPVLVVGHSRSRGSRDVLAVACDLARRLGAVVHVVHAISLDDYPVDPDADDWEAQAARALRTQRAEVEAALTGVPGWSYHAARGDPVKLLCAVAEEQEALMIVVGTRGAGGGAALARLLNRSVSRAVIGCQRRPVLVVPSAP